MGPGITGMLHGLSHPESGHDRTWVLDRLCRSIYLILESQNLQAHNYTLGLATVFSGFSWE